MAMASIRGFYHMDSMIRQSNNIEDFIEEIKLFSLIPLCLVSDELIDYQVVSSDMDEEPIDVANDIPFVQEDEDEVSEDEVKEFNKYFWSAREILKITSEELFGYEI